MRPVAALAGLTVGAVLALVVRARRKDRARPELHRHHEAAPAGVDFGPTRPGVIRHVRLIGYQPPENE